MTGRLDAVVAREKDGKTYWTKVGAAFPTKSGDGLVVVLDAMPAPVDGQFKLSLMKPRPRDGETNRGPASSGPTSPRSDDYIAF